MNPQPVASIALRQETSFENDFLQLNRPSFMYQTRLAITAQCDVAFFCSGLVKNARLDLATALCARLLELVDEATQTVVEFPPPQSEPTGSMDLVNLDLDSTAQLWKDVLEPEKAYILRLSADGGDTWCYRRYRNASGARETDTSEKLAVRRECERPNTNTNANANDDNSTIRFTVYADPAPPTFSAVFSVVSPQPYAFVAELTNTTDQTITVCTLHTPFGSMLPFGGLSSLEQLVYCVDDTTNEEAEFSWAFQCFDSDPWSTFPEDSDFVEMGPGGTWRFEYETDLQNELDAGRYRAELSRIAKLGYNKWMFGRKEELLRGTVEDKIERWRDRRGRGYIRVEQVNGPVVFDMVE